MTQNQFYDELSSDRSSASKREYEIKKLTRLKKLQLIEKSLIYKKEYNEQ